MRNQNGSFTLILCLALAFFGLVGGVYFFASDSKSEQEQQQARAIFDSSKARLEQAFLNPQTWTYSVARNPNAFGCLKSSNGNCQGQGGLFVTYDSEGPLSQLNFASGLNAQGMGCQGFPSPECAVRIETKWEPVCSPNGPCDHTRSARIFARLILDDGKSSPEEWTKESLVTPHVELSQAVVCERGGGVWALTECLTHDQASQRQIASGGTGGIGASAEGSAASNGPALAASYEEDAQPRAYLPDAVCPPQQIIQGEWVNVEMLTPNRGQVRVPAMNGCPAEDTFIFQCQPISNRDREGQWVQIEAQMAPPCDANGNPVGSMIQQ